MANGGSPYDNGVREQDQYMPIANVIRIMRRILPPHAKISDEAKKTIQECVSEYISFITGEANDRCQREQRKTVTAEDVLWAIRKLGFDDYVEPLALYLHRYRESDSDRSPHHVAVRRSAANHGSGFANGTASYGSGFSVDPNPIQGMFDPSDMGGFYYRDDGSGSSLTNFDSYSHIKGDYM